MCHSKSNTYLLDIKKDKKEEYGLRTRLSQTCRFSVAEESNRTRFFFSAGHKETATTGRLDNYSARIPKKNDWSYMLETKVFLLLQVVI